MTRLAAVQPHSRAAEHAPETTAGGTEWDVLWMVWASSAVGMPAWKKASVYKNVGVARSDAERAERGESNSYIQALARRVPNAHGRRRAGNRNSRGYARDKAGRHTEQQAGAK